MNTVSQIVIGSKPAPVVAHAAKDLQRYLKDLYKKNVSIYARPQKRSGTILSLDNPGVAAEMGLSDQGYAIAASKADRREVIQISGGSPVATAWGAYELAESCGVRFLLHRDLIPDRPAPLRVPRQPIIREPDLRIRGFRTYNDLWTPCHWPANEFETMLNQLMKLRFNAIIFVQYPDDACYHQTWQGAAKDVAAPNYGFRIPITRDAIGYELFEKSGDAARGVFANPDLCFEKDYQSTVRAGRRFFRRICAMARQRGIDVSATLMFDFPWPIKQRLVERTDKSFRKDRSNLKAAEHKGHFLEPPTQIIRYGKSIAGATKEMSACMSIRNPKYLDLMRSTVQNYIDTFEGAEYVVLTTAEFRPSASDMEFAWSELDRKYGLSKNTSLAKILRDSRALAEVDPDRSEYELRADICMLWMYDYLIHVKPARRTRRSPKVVPGRLSFELHPFLPTIFPDVDYYLTWSGYLPTELVKRQDTMAAFTDSPLNAVMWITVEDDNVGIVPQYTGDFMQKLIKIMHRHKTRGFFTRQFLQSKLLPSLDYLAHAAWDSRLTTRQSYEHLFAGACGKSAMRPLTEAIRVIGLNTKQMYDNLDCVSFLMPQLVANMAPVTLDRSPPSMVSDKVIKRFRRIGQLYGRGSRLLEEAVRLSRPAGKPLLHAMQRQAQFGHQYMRAMEARSTAINWRCQFIEAKKQRHIHDAIKYQDTAFKWLDEARDYYHMATQSWADGVEDRGDLSVLACLNHYVRGAMDSIHHLASLEDSWSCLP